MNLKEEQEKTLKAERLKYSLISKLLFLVMDIIYKKDRTLLKFRVLELLARVPYQVWESGSYRKISFGFKDPDKMSDAIDSMYESRTQQDNEQWHLLILEELIAKKNLKQNFIMYTVFPQLSLIGYRITTIIIYMLFPRFSYRLNAYFEDHAEHEYMHFVQENPQFEDEPFVSDYSQYYGSFDNVADFLRQVGLDERHHKEQCLKY
ncbi:MAG: hypothetical protein ISR65_08240 [Bacteriovoracaceae bacterium]|nr:hypothetical protein [Bacteriovoracaceae bacterium]